MICNILDNAISFSHEGKIRVILKRDKRNGQNFLIISVKDMGPGIDPEISPKLFTKFASKSDSTGLGLFISKGIVEAHGGEKYGQKIIHIEAQHLALVYQSKINFSQD